ncbi:MAG: sodium:glutamate symporter [Clostridiales bacterium]|nr:sodium:glutamate symporter [Clostridiales bacterium]
MDFSSANTALWNPIIQIGIIAGLILFANVLRRKISFIRKSLMPTAVLGGFLLLLVRSIGILKVDTVFLETVTYHAIALGFIALALRVPTKENNSGALIGSKSGALIVSTYLVQAITGLVISLVLAYTFMPELFKASGILLPMAYGQGPGQANNVGSTYEALGMAGGRSFGLSLAAMGYLCACTVGVVFLNLFNRKGKLTLRTPASDVSGSVTVDTFQDQNEIPISESVDKLSVQAALVALVYLLTYLITTGIVTFLEAVAPGVAATVSTLLWGFNFIIGSLIATLCRVLFRGLRSVKIMNRQYQNNYLLSRLSGLAFDVMIVAGIASINIEDLTGYWVPFLLMAVAGGVVTYYYLNYMCKKLYPDYSYEGFFSMYGMLTGTISSGVLLLREIDPSFETPAANNLVTGSSFGIAFGAPPLVLISMAAKSDLMVWVVFFLIFIYLAALLSFIFLMGKKKKTKQ